MKRVSELDEKLLQRINLFFCFKLSWSHTQARAALGTVYGQNAMNVSSSRHWFKSFKDGRTSLVDLQRAPKDKTGCSDANIQAVRTLIDTDHSVTFASIMMQTGFAQTTVHRIVTKELKLRLRCAKLLPAFLTPRHIVQKIQHSSEMLQRLRTQPSFLKKVVTMDEAWCYQYNPLLKRHASQWLSPGDARPVHPRCTISVKKIMLVAFFDWKGMIHFEFIKGGTIDTPPLSASSLATMKP